jgi:hypothetical protein
MPMQFAGNGALIKSCVTLTPKIMALPVETLFVAHNGQMQIVRFDTYRQSYCLYEVIGVTLNDFAYRFVQKLKLR